MIKQWILFSLELERARREKKMFLKNYYVKMQTQLDLSITSTRNSWKGVTNWKKLTFISTKISTGGHKKKCPALDKDSIALHCSGHIIKQCLWVR